MITNIGGCACTSDAGIIKINITKSTFEPKYHAKLIWEALFRETEAWKWDSLYDFLCDLRGFEELHDAIMYWAWDKSGWTDLKTYDQWYIDTYRIEIMKDEIVIMKMKEGDRHV